MSSTTTRPREYDPAALQRFYSQYIAYSPNVSVHRDRIGAIAVDVSNLDAGDSFRLYRMKIQLTSSKQNDPLGLNLSVRFDRDIHNHRECFYILTPPKTEKGKWEISGSSGEVTPEAALILAEVALVRLRVLSTTSKLNPASIKEWVQDESVGAVVRYQGVEPEDQIRYMLKMVRSCLNQF